MTVNAASGSVNMARLDAWAEQQQQLSLHEPGLAGATAAASTEVLLVMFDPCCEALTPGWPLRNALLLAAVRWGVGTLKVLCVRDSSAGRAKAERCLVMEVSCGPCSDGANSVWGERQGCPDRDSIAHRGGLE